MQSFRHYLIESGKEAGKMEIVSTSFEEAEKYASKLFSDAGQDLNKVIPNFKRNYLLAQKMAKAGHTKRRDMPVIRRSEVWLLQRRLLRGALDINKPYAPETSPSNPFPQGLTGKEAEKFLKAGFRDGNAKDDVVDYSKEVKHVRELWPIQQQIYFDQAVQIMVAKGRAAVEKSMIETNTLVSKDNRILDGHHRWLACMLYDPNTKMSSLVIDMELNKLLKVLLAYSDAIGNKRNA